MNISRWLLASPSVRRRTDRAIATEHHILERHISQALRRIVCFLLLVRPAPFTRSSLAADKEENGHDPTEFISADGRFAQGD
jgi:hypothetical protein